MPSGRATAPIRSTHGSYNAQKIQNALGPGRRGRRWRDRDSAAGRTWPACDRSRIRFRTACRSTSSAARAAAPAPSRQDDARLHSADPARHERAGAEGLHRQHHGHDRATAGGRPRLRASGVEHREQSGSYQPDAIYAAGESAGVPSRPDGGRVRRDEFYGEMRVPILQGCAGRGPAAGERGDPLVRTTRRSAAIRPPSSASTGGRSRTCCCAARSGKASARRASASCSAPSRASTPRIDDPCSDYAGESWRTTPAAGRDPGELPRARRPGHLHAVQSADLRHHRRQPRSRSGDLGRLHGGARLQPALGEGVRRGPKR